MKSYHKNKEKIVSKVFQDVSDKYDLMNDLMSLGVHRLWKKTLIEYLNPQIDTSLIDVASGTGDIAKLFLDKTNNRSKVYCVDENDSMLKISKKKLNHKNNIKWFCSNAEQLPFEDNKFDYYTISFGIRNVVSIDNAFSEAFRVLKPGGRFLCLEFSKVENEILNKFYKIYSKSIPKIGKFIVGKSDPYDYLINSIQEFYSQHELLRLIEKQNFSNVTFQNLSAGVVAIHSGWKI